MRKGKLRLLDCVVVIAVFGILLFVFAPVGIVGSKGPSRMTRCSRNLRNVADGLYAAQQHGVVEAKDIQATLSAYNVDAKMYACPDVATDPVGSSSYGFNTFVRFLNSSDPQTIVGLDHGVVVADVVSKNAAGEKLDVRWPKEIRPRHRGLCNVLTYDGAVLAIAPAAIDPLACSTVKSRWAPTQATKFLTANCDWIGPPLTAVPACPAPANR